MSAPEKKRSQMVINFVVTAGLLAVLPKFTKLLFTTLSSGVKPAKKPYISGQVRETIDFTTIMVNEGRMTPEEKERLDNEAMRANALYYLITGEQTIAEEKPDEWKPYEQ